MEGSVFWFAIPYVADHLFALQMSPTLTSGKLDILNQNFTDSERIREGYIASASTSFKQAFNNHHQLQSQSLQEVDCINILIADDSLTILKMSAMLLRRQGHTVTQAENGAEALKVSLRASV